MKYNFISCGGTFDFLHRGHKEFLRFAFSLGKEVIIGLTTDKFVHQQKHNQQIRSYSQRRKVLITFLQQENLFERAKIIPIDTIFGPTLEKDNGIDALVMTEETKKNAILINQERQRLNLSKLPMHIMPIIRNNGIIISSQNIRNGTIDLKGNRFVDPIYFSQSFFLPQDLRSVLHKPFGHLMQNNREEIKKLNPNMIVSVGDVTTARFNNEHIGQKISVIDYVVERKKTYETLDDLGFSRNEKIISLNNPAHMITDQAWQVITEVVKKIGEKDRYIIQVNGEEDLLVIPLVLSLPLGFYIFYGQPHEGIVKVQVTLASKKRTQRLFKRFDRN